MRTAIVAVDDGAEARDRGRDIASLLMNASVHLGHLGKSYIYLTSILDIPICPCCHTVLCNKQVFVTSFNPVLPLRFPTLPRHITSTPT